MASEALIALIAAGPVVTGATHPGYTVKPLTARKAAQTVAERAPGDIPRLLDMLGITGEGGPDGGRWAVYAYGRPCRREKTGA